MSTVEQRVVELEEMLHEAVARIFPAVRNLRELSPGFPSSTPGNGSPGGGKGGSRMMEITGDDIGLTGDAAGDVIDLIPVTSVEASVLEGHGVAADPAVAALAEIERLTRQLRRPVERLATLTAQWGYPNAGEFTADRARVAKPSESEANVRKWCAHHARVQLSEPSKHVIPLDGVPTPLCDWCNTFRLQRGDLPMLQLLVWKSEGRRITAAVIEQARQAATRPKSTKKNRKRRSVLAGAAPTPERLDQFRRN